MTGELKFECESGIRNRRYPRNNITFETYWVNAQSFEVVSNNSVLTFDNAWERLKGVEVSKKEHLQKFIHFLFSHCNFAVLLGWRFRFGPSRA